MACDELSTPILNIVNLAYELAGNSNSPKGPDAEKAKILLNMILAGWSGTPAMITFETTIVLEGVPNRLEYTIGTGTLANVKNNPFTLISSIYYNVGAMSYRVEYLPKQSFDAIVQKNMSNSYPKYYTYTLEKNHTSLRFWPTPTNATIFSISGMQRLEDVSYFTSESTIPDQNKLFLTYSLAKHLINTNRGNPQSNFYNDYNELKNQFLSSNQIDTQLPPPSLPRSLKNIGSTSNRGY